MNASTELSEEDVCPKLTNFAP